MIKPTVPPYAAGFTFQGSPYQRGASKKAVAEGDRVAAERLISEAISNVIEAAKSGSVSEQKMAADALQELVFALMKEGTEEDLVAVKERSKEIKDALSRVKATHTIPDVDLYDKSAEIEKSDRIGTKLSVDV